MTRKSSWDDDPRDEAWYKGMRALLASDGSCGLDFPEDYPEDAPRGCNMTRIASGWRERGKCFGYKTPDAILEDMRHWCYGDVLRLAKWFRPPALIGRLSDNEAYVDDQAFYRTVYGGGAVSCSNWRVV